MSVVERGACLRVWVSVRIKMSKRTSIERVAQSYWDWLPAELQQWILRLVRLDAANQLSELVANPSILRRLQQRFDLQREMFRPSWNDIPFMQRIFTRGPLLQCFRDDHSTPYTRVDKEILNYFFAIDGFEGCEPMEDTHKRFLNVDALVCCTYKRIYCAYDAWASVNCEIAPDDHEYCCDTVPKLRVLVQTAFQLPPRNRIQLRRCERISPRDL